MPDSACPLCTSAHSELLSDRDRSGRPLRTVICRGCGLGRVDPLPATAIQAEFHGQCYRREYKGIERPRPHHVLRAARVARDRVAWMRPWLSPGARVLDVGCGGGELVYALTQEGFRAEGLDCDARYTAYAKHELGLTIATGSWSDTQRAPGSLDAVVLFHVLEHIPDPVGCLAAISRWLTPGGRIVVEVPNLEFQEQRRVHRYHRAHVLHVSRLTLAAIGRAAGLRPVLECHSPDHGNLYAVFSASGQATACTGIPGHCDEILERERQHPEWHYWFSLGSLRRTVRRLSRLAEERWTAARNPEPRAILESLWVSRPQALAHRT